MVALHEPTPTNAPASTPPKITGYALYALGALSTTNIVAYLDRQITGVLLQPIKLEMHLSDTQLGFLSGVTFALFYATMGIPIAMLADRGRRRDIITVSLVIFSAMTAACGLASNFWQLVVARVFVGFGEGGTGPPIHSLIADYFPRHRRSMAVSVYGAGINVGMLLGFLVGGWVAQLYGWRAAFMVCGVPGLVLAVVVFTTVREPTRGQADGMIEPEARTAPSLALAIRRLFSRPAYRHLVAGSAIYSLAGFALLTWVPSFLARSYGMKSGEIGMALALLLGPIGAAGTLLSGYAADRLSRRDGSWSLLVPALGLGLFGLGSVAMLLASGRMATLMLFAIPAFSASCHTGPATAMAQTLAPLRMRVISSALFMFAVNLIGMAGGAQIVGMLSDHFQAQFGTEGLRYALICTIAVATPWGMFHLIRGSRTLEADIALAHTDSALT